MKKRNLPALIHALSGAAALVSGIITRRQIIIAEQPAKAIGYGIFVLGGLLFAYSLLFLRSSFSGNVEPVGDKFITQGPYRVVRHPVYLAMLVMCLGLAFGLRSWAGIGVSLLIFLPSAVWRARPEDAALSSRFGEEWAAYQKQTHFLLPFIY